KINALENPDRLAALLLLRVPIGDIVQFCNYLALEARLLAHLSERRVLQGFAGLDLPLRQSPAVAHADERDLDVVFEFAVNDAAGRDHAEGRGRRSGLILSRALHPTTANRSRCRRGAAAR